MKNEEKRLMLRKQRRSAEFILKLGSSPSHCALKNVDVERSIILSFVLFNHNYTIPVRKSIVSIFKVHLITEGEHCFHIEWFQNHKCTANQRRWFILICQGQISIYLVENYIYIIFLIRRILISFTPVPKILSNFLKKKIIIFW